MTPERWSRVKALFDAALELEPADRAGLLARTASEDPTLAQEVRRLLDSDERAGAFLGKPLGFGSALLPDESTATPTLDPQGRRLGPYRLLSEIGYGGMGSVFLAVRDDDEYQKRVAIKLIRGEWDSALLQHKFKAERQILANLEHPGIARLIDGGTTEEGWPYFSMEYVEGEPIDRYCEIHALGLAERLLLFRAVCAAVQYAHRNLVVHRDLKPANILVTGEGTPKLLDFGIAKLLEPGASKDGGGSATLTGWPLMTPDYASPEQVRGDRITTASDVYSLGVLLYELLTGVRPYEVQGGSAAEILRVVCETEPEPPSLAVRRRRAAGVGDGGEAAASGARADRRSGIERLPRALEGDLDTIVLKALRKEPNRRYGSVEELSEDIRRHLEGRPVTARADTLAYRAGKFVRRHQVAVAAGVLVLLSLVGGILTTARQARIARANEARALRRFNDVKRLTHSFLFDFHDAIRHLRGSTPARELVVKQALAYLDSLAREAADDPSLQRDLAAAYEKVGDIQGGLFQPNLGDTVAARTSYGKALEIRQALAALDPSSIAARRDLADSYSKTADMLWATGQPAAAAQAYGKALSIDEVLAAAAPEEIQARLRLAGDYSNVGYMLGASGDTKRGLQQSRRAVAIFEELLAGGSQDAAVRAGIARTYHRIGEILDATTQEQGEALEMSRRALAIRETLAASDPSNASLQHAIVASAVLIGDIRSKMGDKVGALQSYGQAFAVMTSLSAADPDNAQYRSDLAVNGGKVGILLVETGDVAGGMARLRESWASLEGEMARNPTNLMARGRAAGASYGLGKAFARLAASSPPTPDRIERWRVARSWYQRSHDLWLDLRNRGTTTGEEAAMPEVIAREIARCDEALGRPSSAEGHRP